MHRCASLAKARDARIRAAQRKGDAKKIASRKAELDEARDELTEAEKPLGA